MGVCASSHSSVRRTTEEKKACGSGGTGTGGGARASESFRRPSTIMVMDMFGGGIKEYKKPIPASLVILENPGCYLCNSESMCIGTCMPRVPDDEELLPGRIYFLVPLSQSHYPLSLPQLCDLVVKASVALANVKPNTSTTTNNGNSNKPSVQRRLL